jgi:spoIIIJ-associated protein
MKEARVFEGADLDEAIRAAEKELGIEAGELQIEVSDEGAKGFLGMGSRPVRISVTLPARETTGRESDSVEGEVVSFQQDVLQRMGLEIAIQLEESGENVALSMSGPDRDRVLQNKAELLEAFQYLLNRIYSKRLGNRRVVLDCGGFRKRKEEELRLIAKRVSEKVKLTGVEEELGMMNPYERRIVHLAVADEEGVVSQSNGDGFMKRVVISPASR